MRRSPKRILMILENESVPDDSRVYLEAVALCAAGFSVAIVCPTGSRTRLYELVDGIHVFRYPRPPIAGGFLGYVFEYLYSLVMATLYACYIYCRRGFDSVHVHTPPDLNALLAICFQFFGKPYVVDMHDLSPELYQARRAGKGNRLLHRLLLWFERVACRRADRLIATNESQRRIQIERCGANPDRCRVVRNGPDRRFLMDVEPIEELAGESRLIIGYVGMIGVQDGVEYFVEALDKLKTRRTDFLGVIVGNGPALRQLRELAKQRGLNEFLKFVGFVDFTQVPRCIAAFDVCVTPDPSNSYNDSCTTVKTMEYMALGRPIVAFETPENRISAGGAALYAKPNDVQQFADCISELLDDPELRSRLGAVGRSRIEESLAWEHQQTQLVALYHELLGRPTSGPKQHQTPVKSPVGADLSPVR